MSTWSWRGVSFLCFFMSGEFADGMELLEFSHSAVGGC